MSDEANDRTAKNAGATFAEEAEQEQVGFFKEFLHFLMHNKKWWLTPIIVVLLLVTLLIVLGGSAAAPFIYTLF